MSSRTRRQFLEDSMFAAAAAVAASSTSFSLAADATKPLKSPNEKLGVAIVGCGGRGGDHLRSFAAMPETEVLYVVDVDEKHGRDKAAAAAKPKGASRKSSPTCAKRSTIKRSMS